MDEMKSLVKLAVDAHCNRVENYSVDTAEKTLREALVEANGGSTKIDIRKVRDGQCGKVFALIEEIIRTTVPLGLQNNALFDAIVDYRNIAEGDQNVFEVEDGNLFFVDKVANGTQGIRRQRLAGVKDVAVTTNTHAVRIYEELNRILGGRADFNVLIDKVNQSINNAILTEIYALWNAATSTDLGGAAYFPTAGTFSEDALLDVIAHVEAAAGGQTATIIGTKKGLRKIANYVAAPAEIQKEAMYDLGYVGKYYGSPVIAVPQRHKLGTTDFAFDDDTISVVAGTDKPIKFVYEGDPLVIPGDPTTNADLTQEYFLAEKWGTAIAMAGNSGIGKYKFA